MSAPTTARRSVAVVIAAVGLLVALLAVWAIMAEDRGEGPVVIEVTTGHGLHRGEVREVGALFGGLALVGVGAWIGRPTR